MKALLCTLILATLGTTAAKADEVTISLDQPNQSASAGDTIQFFGTLTNNTNQTIYLNGDDLTVNGLSLTITDQIYNTVPTSLAPAGQAGDSTGDIELFDVTVSDPLVDPAGVYIGAYSLLGGTDPSASDVLENPASTFSVTTVAATPEPSSLCLLLTGMLAAMGLAWKGIRPRIA